MKWVLTGIALFITLAYVLALQTGYISNSIITGPTDSNVTKPFTEPEITYPISTEGGCTDSDGGINQNTKGTVTHCTDGCIDQTDFCVNEDTLQEYYCTGGLRSIKITCEYGCLDNICIVPEPEPQKPVSDYVNDPIVLKSKELIIKYGFSEEYFDEHFSLTGFSPFEIPNGASVEWTFERGEFQTSIYDGIGYSRDGDNYTYIHSIAPAQNLELPVMTDFSVISKTEADALMKSCIGDFINEQSRLNLLGPERGFFYRANPIGEETEICPTGGYDGPCVENVGIIDLQQGVLVSCPE